MGFLTIKPKHISSVAKKPFRHNSQVPHTAVILETTIPSWTKSLTLHHGLLT